MPHFDPRNLLLRRFGGFGDVAHSSEFSEQTHLNLSNSVRVSWRAERKSDSVCVCVCVYTSQVIYLNRKCYAKGIIEALCTCLLQTAASVDSNTDKVWQLGEDEQHSDAFQTLRKPPEGHSVILQSGFIIYNLGLSLFFTSHN